jgi:hypothetical protein
VSIFSFLHPLNYLRAPNGLVGILSLKESTVDFHKETRTIAGDSWLELLAER